MGQLARQFAAIPEAVIIPFNIPTLAGFGAASGFNFLIQDRSGAMTVAQLGDQARKFLAAGRQRPEFGSLFTSFDPNYPQVKVDLDREKARTLGVPVNEAFQTLSSAMGGTFVNDFNRFGRLYRVYVQAEASNRLKSEDIGNVYVRSKTTNSMIPLSTLLSVKESAGTELTTRFNLLRSVEIQGAPAVGYTSGQAMAALEQVFTETMPKEMGFAYSQLSYQQKLAPPAAPTFILAIVCVFLLLAALYESWRLPWAVLLGSPLVALGAFFGVWVMGYDNNVYVQIGLVMLIGLAAKNAILIIEFAKAKHEEGMPLEEAALTSARLRFRPILMTAFAFILGVVPLMRANGAGAGAQNVMGTGVFWGMLVATFMGVFIIPGNYTFIEGLGRRRKKAVAVPASTEIRDTTRCDCTCGRRCQVMMRRLTIAFIVMGLLTACKVGPNYKRPGVPAPTVYRGVPNPAAPPDPQTLADTKWFDVFKDDKLQDLIRQALVSNYDLREAVARVSQARANYGITRSNQFPQIGVSADQTTARLSRNGSTPLPEPIDRDRGFGSVLLNLLSFEVDIWGRLRRATESAKADLLASEETRKAVITTLVSDVATAYFNLRELDVELEIEQRTLTTRQESLRIITSRQQRGVSNMLELRQAEQLVYQAKDVIPLTEQAIEQQENFLSFLLGRNPSEIVRGPGSHGAADATECSAGPAVRPHRAPS